MANPSYEELQSENRRLREQLARLAAENAQLQVENAQLRRELEALRLAQLQGQANAPPPFVKPRRQVKSRRGEKAAGP